MEKLELHPVPICQAHCRDDTPCLNRAKWGEYCRKHLPDDSQAGSRPEMVEFLVHQGVDSISANADAVQEIRRIVARVERKVLLGKR